MSDSKGSDRDFERLSKAITESVLRSEKVRKIIAEIQKKEKICPQSFMVLVLNMQSLFDAMEMDVQEEPAEKKPSKRPKKKKSGQEQFIDGKKLSKNEVAFHEFSSEKFDSGEWLKKNGLIL